MELRLFLEHRFKRTPDGRVWSPFFTYELWTRYLKHFEPVVICARVAEVRSVGRDLAQTDGPGVRVYALPHYQGPLQYLKTRREFTGSVDKAVAYPSAYIVRVPGNVGDVALSALKRRGRAYSIEVVADPWDMFSPGSSTHPLRWVFRRKFRAAMRRQCREAKVGLYVTESALQKRYPLGAGGLGFGVSDVVLPEYAFVKAGYPRDRYVQRPFRLVSVGTFNMLYKAQDVLVSALAEAVESGLNAELTFVGDGVYREKIESLAKSFHLLHGRVHFAGQVQGGAAVRNILDESHMFVLPSRQEGMPRAALEAMARGLPCIGSNVGGFPEILERDAIVEPNDVGALAERILVLAGAPDRLSALSHANLMRASDFAQDALDRRRDAYFLAVKELYLRNQ